MIISTANREVRSMDKGLFNASKSGFLGSEHRKGVIKAVRGYHQDKQDKYKTSRRAKRPSRANNKAYPLIQNQMPLVYRREAAAKKVGNPQHPRPSVNTNVSRIADDFLGFS